MNMKKITLLLISAAFALNLQAQELTEGIVFMDNEPWQTVLEKAKDQNKPIFMDCYTTWCGPCKALSESIFPQKEVGDFFNPRFINVKYDMEKGDGKMLYEKYKDHIPGFPTLLLINPDGNVIHQMAGYMEAGKLIDGMRAGSEGLSLFALQERYDAGERGLEFIESYVDALDAAVQDVRKAEVIREFIGAMDDFSKLENPVAWKIAGTSIRDPYSPIFRYVVDHIDKALAHRAQADRYKLESQLGTAISNEIKSIFKILDTNSDADTLSMANEKKECLRELLTRANVKNFPEYVTKIELHDLMAEGKTMELFNDLAVVRRMGLLRNDNYFIADCYACIIDNVKDKKIIRKTLDNLLEVQGPQRENPSPLSRNFYDKIARGYTKLGDKNAAAQAQAEYEKREAATKKYVQELST